MELYVNISESDSPGNKCYISGDVLSKLQLVPGRIYSLRFGWCNARAKIYILGKGKQQSVKISPIVFKELSLPGKLETGISILNNDIVFGPVLGVFVTPRYIKDLEKQSPRPSSLHMLKANENMNLFIYFFSIDDTCIMDNRINGWYYSRISNTWVRDWLPLPDVVYDRGTGFYKKEKAQVKKLRKHFTPQGPIKRINSSDCLDKYWLFERLKQHEDIKQFLPETVRYKSINDLTQMFEKYKVVFLKSFYGSCSSEVMTVTMHKDGCFKCSYFDSNRLKHATVKGTDSLSDLVKGFFKEKEFIVQQGIDLLEYDGSLIDMRILIQKNSQGMWTCVYNAAVMGQRYSPITANNIKGGKFCCFTEIMPLVLNMHHNEIEELDRQLKQACIKIAQTIEMEYGMFGEIGMDMALDRNLKIWFIEANSKPDRSLEPGIKGSARVRATCLNIISYSKYLAGFYRKDNI